MSKRNWEEKEAFQNKPNFGPIAGDYSAFPTREETANGVVFTYPGLTIRHYFAGQIAAANRLDDWPNEDDWAKAVWSAADALLRNA